MHALLERLFRDVQHLFDKEWVVIWQLDDF